MQLAFYFDSSACSGCKACQVACKDKHNLEVGRLWRRVYEVSGGEWTQAGDAWQTTAYAYHLSIACNHCEVPICSQVCPTNAIYKRSDGIVLIDSGRCIGCKYCSWACPYGALQYNPTDGVMTKCTFCFDEIDAGNPPVCVSACPMRVLDYGDRQELELSHREAKSPYPLPDTDLTNPALVITPHRWLERAGAGDKITNREEIFTQPDNAQGKS
jgi:anaerobic dimethyl sulfoxide reductase subunit B (iron-sulfur subunit)